MAYKCFTCRKELKEDSIKKRVRCIYCGSKIVYKERTSAVTITAR